MHNKQLRNCTNTHIHAVPYAPITSLHIQNEYTEKRREMVEVKIVVNVYYKIVTFIDLEFFFFTATQTFNFSARKSNKKKTKYRSMSNKMYQAVTFIGQLIWMLVIISVSFFFSHFVVEKLGREKSREKSLFNLLIIN